MLMQPLNRLAALRISQVHDSYKQGQSFSKRRIIDVNESVSKIRPNQSQGGLKFIELIFKMPHTFAHPIFGRVEVIHAAYRTNAFEALIAVRFMFGENPSLGNFLIPSLRCGEISQIELWNPMLAFRGIHGQSSGRMTRLG